MGYLLPLVCGVQIDTSTSIKVTISMDEQTVGQHLHTTMIGPSTSLVGKNPEI